MKHYKDVYFIIIYILTTKAIAKAADTAVNEKYKNLIKSNLNSSAEPCDDFYEYTCGNWYQTYNGSEYMDMPGYMDYKVNEQFKEIFNKLTNKSDIHEKVINVYAACENLETLALNTFLLRMHKELNMQWPIFALNITEWKNHTQFDWLSTIAKLRGYGLNGVFITQNINVQPSNGSHFVLEITQHTAALNTLEFHEVEEIFMNFGFYHNESHALTTKLIQLENDLNSFAKLKYINESEEHKYSDNFKLTSMEELQKTIPEIDWLKYFAIILNQTANHSEFKNLPIQTFALDLEYYTNLIKLLNNTSNETLAYYIMLKFMFYINTNLPHSRPRDCIKYLRGHMSLHMNYLYEQYEFKTKRFETESSLRKIFKNLKLEFQEMIKENHLKLDEQEQEFILTELHEMQLKIGNLPSNCSEEYIVSYYQDLKINRTDFLGNHLNMLKFLQLKEYAKLENNFVNISNKIYDLAASTLASSSPVKIFDNAILIPYGYLQMPLYDYRLADLYQYSHFGFILAHEIIHAYDLFHIIYDHQGNYNYLGSRVASHYWPYMHCYAHSPSDILSENIADISGLRLAYRTYQHVVKDMENSNLLFFNHTKEQFFFVNSVQFLCANVEKISKLESTNLELSHDMHDTRVRRNWANFEEFAHVYHCSVNSTMYTNETCRLW